MVVILQLQIYEIFSNYVWNCGFVQLVEGCTILIFEEIFSFYCYKSIGSALYL